MPFVRFIHAPDIRIHGEAPVLVEDVEVRVLTADRRAVLVSDEELAELSKPKLVELADEADVPVSPKDTKAKIVEKLQADAH
jgi:magnesium-transporting ATPase (P-type)